MGWAEDIAGFWVLECLWPVTAEQVRAAYDVPWYTFVVPFVPVALAWIGLKELWRIVKGPEGPSQTGRI